MKDHLIIILGWIACCVSSVAWAHSPPPPGNTLEVQIAGLEAKPLTNVFKALTEKQKEIKDNFGPAGIMEFYRHIPKEIKDSIKPYGYFKSHIRSYIHRRNQHYWFSHFTVNPGPRMRFMHVKLRIIGPGSSDPAFQHLYQHFPIKSGDFFDSEKYEQAKNDLFDVAAARGFFKAKMMKSQIQVNLDAYRATVIITFETGPRFHFGATHFSTTPFNESFLHRFLQYRTGHYFDQKKVRETREGLANSNYFSTVVVAPEPERAKGLSIPVKIHLRTEPKKQYNFGLGYGTDTGVRALINTNFRWINSYGHRFNAFLLASRINSALVANYYIPGRNPATDQYIFTTSFSNQDQDTGKGKNARISFSYQTNLGGWQQIFSLTALKERYNLTDLPKTNTHLVYPTILWQRIHADNLLNPTSGYSLVATINGAAKSFFSKTSFLQERFDARFLFTLWHRTRFLIRASAGYTSIKNILNLPLSLQFFAGGAQSLRGFSYNSIGPGRGLFVGSFEIQQKIVGNFYLAGFFDAGNVSDQLFKDKLKEGVGPGLVYLTPIGMFELTVANAISEPTKPWVVQFSMGSAI